LISSIVHPLLDSLGVKASIIKMDKMGNQGNVLVCVNYFLNDTFSIKMISYKVACKTN